ncbi:hypothetical protein CEXT_384031 [Caerostris extrusa]|uniref:Uncharacterized protein n=1 Tax=Caerostris extrusa TaxID=172846 RepID=A0AAV4Y8J0_CAEEX|nr:hypothetical protein CEXT_384031 [Caerostris extrusa]
MPKYDRHKKPNDLCPSPPTTTTFSSVSNQTIQNHLHPIGLYAGRLMVFVSLTAGQRRREWTREHANWRRH